MIPKIQIKSIAFLGCALLAHVAHAEHMGDLWVARTSSGQLAISPMGLTPDDNYLYLIPVNGFLNGWSDNDPGFDRITSDQPAFDLYPLETGSSIYLEVIEMDPALRLIDNAFVIIHDPGDTTYLGGSNLHIHNTWHINSDDLEFDPTQCVWEATFVLFDTGPTSYTDSTAFTLLFTNVELEEPDGDFDDDGVINGEDHTAFYTCLAGPETRTNPSDPTVTTCEVECVNNFDFDADLDVDLEDAAAFQEMYDHE